MPTVRFTLEAEKDLLDIVAYIGKDNPTAAERWLKDIRNQCDLLARQPGIGKIFTTRRFGNVRRIARRNYYIYYLPSGADIEVLRILHAARRQDRLL